MTSQNLNRHSRPKVAAALAIALLTAACTTIIPSSGAPTVIANTPFGSYPIANQPGGPAANQPPPANSGDRSGTYSGTATVLTTGGGVCLNNRRVSGFHVRGNSVRWGQFHGTIASDNGLQMVYGTTWVFGQFVGDRFDGQISMGMRWNGPGCSFMMSLTKNAT